LKGLHQSRTLAEFHGLHGIGSRHHLPILKYLALGLAVRDLRRLERPEFRHRRNLGIHGSPLNGQWDWLSPTPVSSTGNPASVRAFWYLFVLLAEPGLALANWIMFIKAPRRPL
jgi:hypothetical protein